MQICAGKFVNDELFSSKGILSWLSFQIETSYGGAAGEYIYEDEFIIKTDEVTY